MIHELTDDNYVEFIEKVDKPVFIDFYSPTCGPCQSVHAMLPHLDERFGEEAVIARVDVTRHPKLAAKYEIRGVPLCVSISATDKKIKDYHMGAATIDRYIAMIEKAKGKSGGFFSRLFGGK